MPSNETSWLVMHAILQLLSPYVLLLAAVTSGWATETGGTQASNHPQDDTINLNDFDWLADADDRSGQASSEAALANASLSQGRNLDSIGRSEIWPSAGYDKGFFIVGNEGDDVPPADIPHKIKLSGFGHFRMTNFDPESSGEDLNQLQLKRARLIFSGHAFTPDFSWLISLDGRSQADGAVRLLDYYLQYDLGRETYGLNARQLTLKLGQYKIPFSLARHVSAKKFQFTDRSVASMFFDANRSLAFGAAGENRRGDTLWTWEAAIFNGLVTGGQETGAGGSLDNNFATSARIAGYFRGDWGTDDLCDYDIHTDPVFRCGAAYAGSTIERSGSTEFDAIRVVDTGAQLSGLLDPAINSMRVNMFAVDLSSKYLGWSGTMEYYFRHVGNFEGGTQNGLFDHGFLLQTGYFVLPKRLELLARWSRVQGNSSTLGTDERSSDERAAGAVWYFRDHSAKLTVDLTYLDGAPINSFSLDVDRGMRGWLTRTQLQFSF